MAKILAAIPQPPYEPRWFIWTIVFLLVSSVGLVSYILVSDQGTSNIDPGIVTHLTIKRETPLHK